MRVAVHARHTPEFDGEVAESVMDVRTRAARRRATSASQRFQLRLEPHGHVRRYEDGFGNAAHLLTTMRAARLRPGQRRKRGRNAARRSVRDADDVRRAARVHSSWRTV